MERPRVLAVGAHPDDIEILMGGTLLLLRERGWEVHCVNVADGCYGSRVHPPARLRKIREAEAREAAEILGAVHHPPWLRDMGVFYEERSLRRLAALIREIKPSIVLVHADPDYMEDHTQSARLAVSAAFVRAAPFYQTDPPRPAFDADLCVYHAVPVGMRDPVSRQPHRPELVVDTSSVLATQLRAVAAHQSQREWVAATQHYEKFEDTARNHSRMVGFISGCFEYAEGWTRHHHVGFCTEDFDPLRKALGPRLCRVLRRSRSWRK